MHGPVALLLVASVGAECADVPKPDPCEQKHECAAPVEAEMPPSTHVPERDNSDQTILMYANVIDIPNATTTQTIYSTGILKSRVAFGNGFLTEL